MDYKYQLSTDITLSYLLSEYEKYTFPNLRDKMRTMDIIDPLFAIQVKSEDIMVGLILLNFVYRKIGHLVNSEVLVMQTTKKLKQS